MENEVLKSNRFENYVATDISGRCHVLFLRDYVRGRPVDAKPESTFVCESRYNEPGRAIAKIKNWSSCVPEPLRGMEPILQLFSTPIVPNRVASAFAETPVVKKDYVEPVDTDDDYGERKSARKRAFVQTPVVVPEKKVTLSKNSYSSPWS